jgi:hypothetical protein
MTRLAAPLAVALAVSLAAPEALAAGGTGPRAMASWSGPGYGQPVLAKLDTAQDPVPAPETGPQPYADPSAPATTPPPPTAEGPQPYADPSAAGGTQSGIVAAPPPAPRSRRKGLMIGGWVMFGSSYLATAFISAIVADSCRALDERGCRNAAFLSMIPVVGPWMAISQMQTDLITPKVFMVFPGAIQLAGLAMGIAGTVQFVRDGREPRYVDANGFKLTPNLRLGVVPTRFHDGGTVQLGYRF